MLRFLFLIFFSLPLFANSGNATFSLQRWNDKLVVSLQHAPGWHTYWKNPGDAGIPSSFKISTNPKAYEWPVPKKYIENGDILTIGYEGLVHFFFDQVKGDVDLKATVLICKDVCIPAEASLKLKESDKFISSSPISSYTNEVLEKAFKSLPVEGPLPSGFEYSLTRVKNKPLLSLHYSLKASPPTFLHPLNLLTPFPQSPWGYKREKLYYKEGTLYGKLDIEWDGEYLEPPFALPENGQFNPAFELKFLLNQPGRKDVSIINLKLENFSLNSQSLDDFYQKLPPLSGSTQNNKPDEEKNLFTFLFFAFLGGLILNLMPCVLPVISLKLFGLIKHQNLPRKKMLAHNLSYTFGVLITFLSLALVVVILKRSGEEVGWGFQLQSPGFILFMMLMLFIMSLNLFGLFEFQTPFANRLGSSKLQDGFIGDFFSGVLTTILSTPCSAPFLGTALTFAFTTSTLNIILIFSFIALGLAFPFLLTAFIPSSLKMLPRPGQWMEKLKYFLGLSLLVTVIWLYDVFVSLVHFEAISWKLNLILALWFFGFFFIKNMGKNKILKTLFFAAPFILSLKLFTDLPLKPISEKVYTSQDSSWIPWSEEKLSNLKGQIVFMDFTAEWCLTCKVNKKLVLDTKAFKEFSKSKKVHLLRADWTRRDDHITQFLKRFQVVGVPAYFIQKANGEVQYLGETISIGKIQDALN